MKKAFVILLGCLLYLSACSDKNKQTYPLFVITAEQARIKTGDSTRLIVQSAPGELFIQTEPQAGRINNAFYYVAPNSIAEDSINVSVIAYSLDRVAATSVTVIKQNENDTVFTYNNHIQPLFNASCNFVACHGNGSRAAGVNLETYDSALKHVVAFQPQMSRLYLSLIKTDPLRRMPPAGRLHPHLINRVYLWIEQGARNN